MLRRQEALGRALLFGQLLNLVVLQPEGACNPELIAISPDLDLLRRQAGATKGSPSFCLSDRVIPVAVEVVS
jgi:hypothetical protein